MSTVNLLSVSALVTKSNLLFYLG